MALYIASQCSGIICNWITINPSDHCVQVVFHCLFRSYVLCWAYRLIEHLLCHWPLSGLRVIETPALHLIGVADKVSDGDGLKLGEHRQRVLLVNVTL